MSVSEHELKERATAPRVTLEYLESQIAGEHYFTAADGVANRGGPTSTALRCLTFCVLTLKNGFTAKGFSACASEENYQEDIAQRISRQDAINTIWPLLGYELRTRLALVEAATRPSMLDAKTYVGTKVIHARPMSRLMYNRFRGWPLPSDENGADEGYVVEYADGGPGNVKGFRGYISWSPKAVFEKAYVDVGQMPAVAVKAEPTWSERLAKEHLELCDRFAKLSNFLNTPASNAIEAVERMDLEQQLEAMEAYLRILNRRMARILFTRKQVAGG